MLIEIQGYFVRVLYYRIYHSIESDLVLLRQWRCGEKQDRMRKIRQKNTSLRSVTKMMRKESATFARNREALSSFYHRSVEE